MAMLSCAFVFSSGCATGPNPPRGYTIQVSLDPSLQGKAVLVDLVGVNPASLPRWEASSMTAYWKPGDAMRKDSEPDRVTMDFASGGPLAQTLKQTDPHWKEWLAKGATYVLVLADLPGAHTNKPGDSDDRRLKLPLSSTHWAKGTDTISVRVQQSGIQVTTPTRQ